jgi:hypothetical protein
MKMESVLEMVMNPRGCPAVLMEQPHTACCEPEADAETAPKIERLPAAPELSDSLNRLVQTHLTGSESGLPVAENLAFTFIVGISAVTFGYLLTALGQFVGALPHFSQFVQGCL